MTSDVLSLEPMKEFVRQNFEGAELKVGCGRGVGVSSIMVYSHLPLLPGGTPQCPCLPVEPPPWGAGVSVHIVDRL